MVRRGMIERLSSRYLASHRLRLSSSPVVIVVLLSAALSTGCSKSGSALRTPGDVGGHGLAAGHGCASRPAVAAGSNVQITVPIAPRLAGGATRRTAVVHVPRGYRAGTPTPVVLEFHGAAPNATAAGYLRTSPLARIADRAGFLDVFPQGLRMWTGNFGWNAYGPVLHPIAELPFVEVLIARLERDFCVNRREIYASGISTGANMVNYLACHQTAREIAAIAPVAGPMYGQDDGPCAPPRPVPILDIHSVNDPAVPYGGIPAGPGKFPLSSCRPGSPVGRSSTAATHDRPPKRRSRPAGEALG
jgi:polyhydroxybutyrate depolymerase